MSSFEDSQIDYKSLKKVTGKTADFSSLAETCVSFANAQGGESVIGIEDKEAAPSKNQKISTDVMNKTVARLRDLTDCGGIKKGTEYLLNPALFAQSKLNIKPSLKTIDKEQLKQLIIEFLKYNGERSKQEINEHIQDVEIR